MLNHVLIPLDGSPLAETALPEAKRILAANGRMTLVIAVDTPQLPFYGLDASAAMIAPSPNEIDGTMKHAHAYLEKVAAELKAQGYHVDTEVQVGEAATVIVETALKHRVDAIAICTHGHSGITRWLFGSVTSKVLGSAHCPIYVIPSLRKEEVPQAVLNTAPAVS